jgi:hypothetical protein
VAFVREKKVRGKDGTIHRYYALVEGRRVGGKVRQRQIAYLGKHPSLEAARAYAAQLDEPEPETGDVETVRGLISDYRRHNQAFKRREPELDGIKKTREYLEEQGTKAAAAESKQLKAREDEIRAHRKEAEAVRPRAKAVYRALSPEDQEKARKLSFFGLVVDPTSVVLRRHLRRGSRRS